MRVVVLGAGGHARMVIETLRAGGGHAVAALLDPDRALWGGDVLGVSVRGGDDLLPRLAEEEFDAFVVGIGSVADTGLRARAFERGIAAGLVPATAVHPTAVVSPSAVLGAGAVLMALCAVNAGARVGENAIVNTGAIVEHDCSIGAHAHVAPGAVLSGGVVVGARAHVGVGAVVRQGVAVGEGAVVGAGAVVVRDVAPWTTVTGVPARPRAGGSGARGDAAP